MVANLNMFAVNAEGVFVPRALCSCRQLVSETHPFYFIAQATIRIDQPTNQPTDNHWPQCTNWF